MSSHPNIPELLQELKHGLEALYGERLRGVYLFGSHARGEADAESDVDVAVVVSRPGGYVEEIRRTGPIASELSLRYGISICPVILDEEDWREADSPFLANVREEAVPA